MSQPEYPLRARRSQFAVAVTAWLLFTGAAWAQAPPSTVRLVFPIVPGAPDDALPALIDADATVGVQRITLKQAKQLAVQAGNPLARLGELQVEAAEQHRLGVKAMYFRNVSG